MAGGKGSLLRTDQEYIEGLEDVSVGRILQKLGHSGAFYKDQLCIS